jgi:hypothetical protein
MYHLVAEHSGHAGRFAHASMTMAAGVGSSLMSATSTEHPLAGPPAVKPVEASVALTAVLASHPYSGDSIDMVGHCCLAVLTGHHHPRCRIDLCDGVAPARKAGVPARRVGAVVVWALPTGSVRCTKLCLLRRWPLLIY